MFDNHEEQNTWSVFLATTLESNCSGDKEYQGHWRLLISQTPSEKKTGLATCVWPSISLPQALAASTRRCGQMRGKFDRHLYCCTEADLAVRSESALRPPPLFFLFTTPKQAKPGQRCKFRLVCDCVCTVTRVSIQMQKRAKALKIHTSSQKNWLCTS